MARTRKAQQTDRRLSVAQAAERLGLHPQTVRRYIGRGILRAFQTPSPSKYGKRHRILESDLEVFVARHAGPSHIDSPPIDGVLNPVDKRQNAGV